jgi:hypothetical protein
MRLIKSTLFKLHHNQSGIILTWVLMFISVGLLLIPPLLSLSYAVNKSATSYQIREKGIYAADSGIQDALWQVTQTNPDGNKVPSSVGSSKTYSTASVNGTQPSVTILCTQISDTETAYKVNSRSDASNPYTEIEAYLLLPKSQSNIFDSAIATVAGGNINLSGATIIGSDVGKQADVFSGANLILSGSPQIQGNCYATSNITLGSGKIDGDASASGTIGSGNITGAKTAGVPVQTPPSIATSDLNNMVQGVYDETFNIGNISPAGTQYPSGLTIQNQNQHISYAIYVVGDLTLKSNPNLVFDNQVYVTGKIMFSGGTQNVTFNGAVYGGGELDSTGGAGVVTFNNTLTVGSMNPAGNYIYVLNNNVKVVNDLTVGNGVSTSFGGTIYTGGNFNYGGASNLNISHDIYIKGSLTLGNSADLAGPEKVVVRGNVSIGGASSLTNPNQLPFLIMPPGSTTPALSPPTDPTSLTLANGGHASAVIYAPTADFNFSGAASLYGAIICKRAELGNSAQIIYPSFLGSRSDLPQTGSMGSPSIKNWMIK